MTTNALSIAIMAGGKSSRMGTDKSFVELHGTPLIKHLLNRLGSINAPKFLVTNRPDEYAYLGLAMVGDVFPDKGALGGIYTAIHHSPTPYVLVIACDMPFVNPDLLNHMLTLADGSVDVIVPRVGGYPQGLHALYHKNCLPHIKSRLDADKLKVIGFYADVRLRYLDEDDYAAFDPNGHSFTNINTPEELIAAQKPKRENLI